MGKVQILAVLTMDGCLSSELYDKAHQDLCLDRCGLDEIRKKAFYLSLIHIFNIIKVDGVDSADEKVIGKRLQEIAKNATTGGLYTQVGELYGCLLYTSRCV